MIVCCLLLVQKQCINKGMNIAKLLTVNGIHLHELCWCHIRILLAKWDKIHVRDCLSSIILPWICHQHTTRYSAAMQSNWFEYWRPGTCCFAAPLSCRLNGSMCPLRRSHSIQFCGFTGFCNVAGMGGTWSSHFLFWTPSTWASESTESSHLPASDSSTVPCWTSCMKKLMKLNE